MSPGLQKRHVRKSRSNQFGIRELGQSGSLKVSFSLILLEVRGKPLTSAGKGKGLFSLLDTPCVFTNLCLYGRPAQAD